ncbi:MAG: SEC-C domain-containing protein, partial [Oscillospiraceae bacterium]|nr:SEC-C domain-containing protein [Oscillospiraceae bacterium]
YFRLYNKLSGMTGTALTEEEEFGTIYKLDIIEIPTNRPLIRKDNNDVVYKTEAGKYRAVIEQIKECHAKGQPVLVGTVSIEKNERLSSLLRKEGIPHNVLNAKNHEKEAEIVAQAGKLNAVTVATNMAGRGTDIMLGGNAEFLARDDLRKAGLTDELIAEATGYAETNDEEILNARRLYSESFQKHKAEIEGEANRVRDAGGLFIIGTERHDSRRIDNQLRGRAGRQGDPGETRFYLSLEDDLIQLFGGDKITALMDRLDLDETVPIENKMLTKSIENAQVSVESRNFQTRKNTLEYDDVMNKQREIIYGQRKQVLDGLDIRDVITGMISSIITNNVNSAFGEQKHLESESFKSLLASLEGTFFPKNSTGLTVETGTSSGAEELTRKFIENALACYAAKETEITPPVMRELERVIMLRVVDEYWMDHIDAMQDLRQGIRLRAYAQSNPVDAYKQESLHMFEEMIAAIQEETVRRLYSIRLRTDQEVKRERVATGITEGRGDGTVKKQPRRVQKKVGRNEPCPCGSGKKYKHCCGRNA